MSPAYHVKCSSRYLFPGMCRVFHTRSALSPLVSALCACYLPLRFRIMHTALYELAAVPRALVERYQRTDVLRILRITARQLASWEKAGLFSVAESYSFFDLLQLRKLRELRSKRVRSAVIRDSLRAMQQQVAGMENPLLEASAFASKSRVAFRHRGASVEPLDGQFVMDFSAPGLLESTKIHAMRAAETAIEYFARGVGLEEDSATQAEAIDSYKRCVELDPTHAAAYINLGTLYYNRQDYVQAEHFYRKAIEVDPRYALAYFDLGNVLDE